MNVSSAPEAAVGPPHTRDPNEQPAIYPRLTATNGQTERFRLDRLRRFFDLLVGHIGRGRADDRVRAALLLDLIQLDDHKGAVSLHWTRRPSCVEEAAAALAWTLCDEPASAVNHLVRVRPAIGGDW